MKIIKIHLVLCLFQIILIGTITAQDLHFSNYETFLPKLNPAMTGFIPGDDDLRAAIIYRNQWQNVLGNSSYQTYGASFDMRNCLIKDNRKHFNNKKSKFKNATWGLGLTFLHDKSGTASIKDAAAFQQFPLNRNQATITTALHKPLNDQNFLTIGFRIGGISQSIITDHLTFDEQFDGLAGFDPTAEGEFNNLNELNNMFLDYGAGVSFMHLGRNRGIIIGGAVDHIWIPGSFNFIENNDNFDLSRRFTGHLKASFTFADNMKKPMGVNIKGIFLQQNTLQQIVGGLDFFYQDTYKENRNFTLTLGGGLRSSRTPDGRNVDAIIAAFTVNLDHYTFGVNYDINASKLTAVSNAYGGWEFSMIYRWKKGKSGCRPQAIGCRDKDTVHAIFF